MIKYNFIKILFVSLFVFISCSKKDEIEGDTQEQEQGVVVPEPTTPLKESATTFFVGVATATNKLTAGSNYDQIIRREFESITAEYQMKSKELLQLVKNWRKNINAVIKK